MISKNLILHIVIYLLATIFIAGCGSDGRDVESALDLTTPEKTIEICMNALRESDNKQLDRISLVGYVKAQAHIEEESEEVRKAYYEDCIAKEWNGAGYKDTIKKLPSVYGRADFSKPQRIIGGNEREVCYKVDAAGRDNYYIDGKNMDLWITLVKAGDENWYVGNITNEARSDWFGNEEITEKAREQAVLYLEEIRDDVLLRLFETISATQLNGNGSWNRGFENPVQISLKGIACLYIHSLTEEDLERLYDTNTGMYRIPIEGVKDMAMDQIKDTVKQALERKKPDQALQ